jgi:hypothetical protein
VSEPSWPPPQPGDNKKLLIFIVLGVLLGIVAIVVTSR